MLNQPLVGWGFADLDQEARDQILHFGIIPCAPRRSGRPADVGRAIRRRRSRCALSRSRTAGERARGRADLERTARRRQPRFRIGVEARRGCGTGWHQRPGDRHEKKRVLEAGIEAGRTAAAANPGAPDGHFWIAANMGALADAHGLRQGIKYRSRSARPWRRHSVSTRLFSTAHPIGPWVAGTSQGAAAVRRRPEEVRGASAQGPHLQDRQRHLVVLPGRTLIELDRKTEASATLHAAIAAPVDPAWIPEDTRFKAQARQLLATLARCAARRPGGWCKVCAMPTLTRRAFSTALVAGAAARPAQTRGRATAGHPDRSGLAVAGRSRRAGGGAQSRRPNW